MSLLDLIPGGRIGLAIGVAAVAAAVYAGHLLDVKAHERRAFAAGKADTQARWDAEKVRQQAAALKAQQEAAAETARRLAADQEQNRVDEKHASQRRADLAAVAARADGVQRQLADLAAGTHRDPAPGDSTPAEQCQATREAAGMLAALLERAERRARVVESYADESADAAESCAGRFDSLRGDSTGTPEAVSR